MNRHTMLALGMAALLYWGVALPVASAQQTKTLEPIDEVSLRGDYESSGRNESKRRSGLESDWI